MVRATSDVARMKTSQMNREETYCVGIVLLNCFEVVLGGPSEDVTFLGMRQVVNRLSRDISATKLL